MRLVILSDTHGQHSQVTVPHGDVLIHCGDCTNDIGQSGLRNFLQWFSALPHKYKIFIAGNHDGAFEKWPIQARQMVVDVAPACVYLEESSVTLEGVKFYGMPHTPEFCNWYFNVRRDLMSVHTDKIPDDTDVLITHGPPVNILDTSGFDNQHCGDRSLYEAVLRVQPKVHCFGHIHHDYGAKELVHDNGWKTICVNAAICDEKYRPTRHPFVFDI